MSRIAAGSGGGNATQGFTRLATDDNDWSESQRAYLAAAAECNGLVQPLLTELEHTEATSLAPHPGSGHTRERFAFLAAVAAADVTAARVLEPHLDAVAILAESGALGDGDGRRQSWGVFAAEGPASTLAAREREGTWTLSGDKPWCSLGGRLTDALVTARTDTGRARLFRVNLRQSGVRSQEAPWVARGLADVDSGPLVMDAAVASPIGEPEWYVSRPGFRWGAIGVAACWWGGCVPLFAELVGRYERGEPNPLVGSRIGRTYRRLESARQLLESAAARIASSQVDSESESDEIAVLAHTVRGVVVDALDETLMATRDILGPGALALNEATARRYADLEMYASQYHRGRDDASLSAHLRLGGSWW